MHYERTSFSVPEFSGKVNPFHFAFPLLQIDAAEMPKSVVTIA